MAVCAALLHRERTGEGQYLDASLTDTYFHMHEMNVPKIALAGDRVKPRRAGSQVEGPGPAGVFRYRDNDYVMILITPHQWPQMVRAMGSRSWPPITFKAARARHANRLELQAIIEQWLGSFPTRDAAIAAMDKERVPCAPVLTVNEAVAHPHLNDRKTVRWVDDPLLGKVAIPGVPVKFSAWPDKTELRSARLGEDRARTVHDYLDLSDTPDSGAICEGRISSRSDDLTARWSQPTGDSLGADGIGFPYSHFLNAEASVYVVRHCNKKWDDR